MPKSTTKPSWAIPGADYELAPGVYFRHIYYYNTTQFKVDIPCLGWQHGIIGLLNNKGYIFCPFTGNKYTVPIDHFLITQSFNPKASISQIMSYIKNKWAEKDLPTYIYNASKLKDKVHKPIKRNSKRGIFVQTIINGCVHIPTLADLLNMTRNNVLSYLYQIQKVNGIEYILNKELDTVKLYIPEQEIWI